MIKYTNGDITVANTEAIINTVNTVGVMGKGIALSFKKSYPENYKMYREACNANRVTIGKMFVTKTNLLLPRLIINFPTKKHWRHPSKYEYIHEGLKDLVKVVGSHNITSIAIPPLGCGNGGLEWSKVKKMILSHFQDLTDQIELVIYQPGQVSAKSITKSSSKLTPARSMLLHLMKHYTTLGEGVTPIIAQKLAYFLQNSGENLRLQFDKGIYGPYSHQLSKVLEAMKPTFITFKGEIKSPWINISVKKSEEYRIELFSKDNLSEEQKKRLQTVKDQISGFENALGLELLATVDFALKQCPNCSLEDITRDIHKWTDRKRDIMSKQLIEVAYKRVTAGS